MLLSIGMIVKNEEKYLGRCLEALQPLLQQVDSELIIIDTGSTDRTVEIAREFTDKVYFFEWCNDFAAARNAGLKRARGAWFMGLDADEIFTDSVQEIIAFFKTGEYKKYNTASIIIRNSNQSTHQVYSDARLLRLTKVHPDTQYINPIHEVLAPAMTPVKELQAIALHYGYVQEDKEFITKKAERNITMLKGMLEKNPTNSKHCYDICKSYSLIAGFEDALHYCELGLQYATGKQAHLEYPLWFLKVVMLFSLGRERETIQSADAYFSLPNKKASVFDLEMYWFAGFLYYKYGEYKEAAAAFKGYVNALQRYQRGEYTQLENFYYEEQHTNQYAFKEAVLKLVLALGKIEDYEAANQYLRTYFQAEWYEVYFFNVIIELEFMVMEKRGDFSRLAELYQMLENSSKEQAFLQRIEEAVGNDAYAEQALAVLATVDSQSEYIQMNQMRYQFRGGKLQKEAVEAFVSSVAEWQPLYADVLYFAVYCGCDWKLLREKVDVHALNTLLFESPSLHFSDLSRVIYEVAAQKRQEPAIRHSFWLTHLSFWSLVAQSGAEDEMLLLCKVYAKEAHACVEWLYSKEVLEESTHSLIPTPLRVGYYFYMALQAASFQEKATYWKAAVKICSKMEHATKLMINALAAEQKGQLEESEQEQLQKYAEIVKTNIKGMIQQGQMTQATALLTEYEKICPNDKELSELRQLLAQ